MTNSERKKRIDALEREIFWVIQHNEGATYRQTKAKLDKLNVRRAKLMRKLKA